ncbi:hypothetical protein F4677DRAFT_373567 [Hypoxylon crocopeplum]|nr:hypothetical protein F4677DRAFT_373567 [Hypoxylon crocopeplum]
MADATGPDRTLLERLNALKPSTVKLDPSSKATPASTIEPAKPLSREDALTERLKSLRNKSDDKVHTASSAEGNRKDDHVATSPSPSQTSQPHLGPGSPTTGVSAPQLTSTEETNYDVDPFLDTDNQTLEELLAELESDQPWLDEVAAEEEEHRRVTALLEELGKASTDQDPDETNQDGSDDDSEGEKMTREADDVLAHAVDEAEWETANETPSQPDPIPSLPSHDIKPSTEGDAANKSVEAQRSNEGDPFELPTVPSDLQDQPDGPETSQEDADFAAFITSRMAALKVKTPPGPTLPSVPSSDVDELGLPAVPTFAPADRPAPGLIKRAGYTDEDQKTWCVVCLEDGAIKCLDCDGDIYCARCWKEVHVGPSAWFDERGHRWEKFVRRR